MKTILHNNQILIKESLETFLTNSADVSNTELKVKNITGFKTNQILLIGELGDENAEIVHTSDTTQPTGSVITLLSGVSHSHNAYTKIRVIPYDQVEIHFSNTEDGSKELLNTINVQPDSLDTRYDETTQETGFYFTRFKNSINQTLSQFSDPIPYEGYGANRVGFVINYALKRNKLHSFTDFIDYQFCIEEINSCLEFITGKLKGWSNLLKLDYVVGQSKRGEQVLGKLPADIWEDKGNKSIYELKLGGGTNLTYLIWSDFKRAMRGVFHSKVRTETTGGDNLEITNSFDFPDTGAVNLYMGNDLYTISYKGVVRSETQGILTGIDLEGIPAIPAGTNIWMGENTGEPTYYSINSNREIVIYPLPDNLNSNKNGYLDYYTGATRVDSDNDELDTFRYDCVKHWLTWAIRMQKDNDGKRDLQDGDYIQFLQILMDYIRNEKPAHRKKRGVKLNTISYG